MSLSPAAELCNRLQHVSNSPDHRHLKSQTNNNTANLYTLTCCTSATTSSNLTVHSRPLEPSVLIASRSLSLTWPRVYKKQTTKQLIFIIPQNHTSLMPHTTQYGRSESTRAHLSLGQLILADDNKNRNAAFECLSKRYAFWAVQKLK